MELNYTTLNHKINLVVKAVGELVVANAGIENWSKDELDYSCQQALINIHHWGQEDLEKFAHYREDAEALRKAVDEEGFSVVLAVEGAKRNPLKAALSHATSMYISKLFKEEVDFYFHQIIMECVLLDENDMLFMFDHTQPIDTVREQVTRYVTEWKEGKHGA